jgi:phage gp29-like protein
MAKNKKPLRKVGIQKGGAITATNAPIIQTTKLDIRQILRQPQDLGKWRNALRVAESIMRPRRVLLYDLYHDIMLDGHLIAVTGKRIDPITIAKWQYVDKEGKPVDEVNELLDSIGFADLLTEIMLSKFWGYSMVECDIFRDEEGRWDMTATQFDRKHMRPESGLIVYDQNGDIGFSVREGRYAYTVLEAGKPRDMGLFISAAQYAILKRNNYADYSNFIEIFGQPIMDAEWDGFDEDQRLKLLESITAMGNSGRLVRPSGTKVNFIETKGQGATGQLQESFKNSMNAEISKALLGTTETVESSKTSGYAQAQEHGDQDDKKNETDLDFTRRILNSRFIKIMRAFGLPVDGGKFIIPEAKKQAGPVETFSMFVDMAQKLNMPVDHEFIYQFTGMPKPADYDTQIAEKKAAAALETQQLAEDDELDDDNTPPANDPEDGKKPPVKVQKKPLTRAANTGTKAKMALDFLHFFGWPRT